jgi:hypothetical protein
MPYQEDYKVCVWLDLEAKYMVSFCILRHLFDLITIDWS